MAERYQKVFSLTENLYAANGVVIVSAGALLKDTVSGNMIAQIKLKSVSPKKIKVVKVSLTTFDAFGKENPDVVDYQYLDLSVQNAEEFGAKQAIVLPDPGTRAYAVKAVTVMFEDGSTCETAGPFVELPAQKTLEETLVDGELKKQYQIETIGAAAAYCPQEIPGLWQCACGTWNGADTCTNCKSKKEAILGAFNLAELTKQKDARLAADKDKLYGSAVKAMGKGTVEGYEEAIKAFQAIPGWKDADAQIALCQKSKQEKIAADKKKKKKAITTAIIIIFLLLAAAAAAAYVYKVAIPNRNYEAAVALMEEEQYEEAISAFTALDGHKDSATKILDCRYAIAVDHMEAGKYMEAAAVFKALDGYKDSDDRYLEALYQRVEQWLEQKDIASAKESIAVLAKSEAYAPRVDEALMEIVSTYRQEEKYTEAIDVYKLVSTFSEESEVYQDLVYQQATKLFNEKEYKDAEKEFQKILGYSDADTLAKECAYQVGLVALSVGNPTTAISNFEKVEGYKDSAAQLKEAKYQYAIKNKGDSAIMQTTGYEYLKELKEANYKDSAKLFKDLYGWKATIVANYSENSTVSMNAISKYDPVYFHVRLNGGEPGEETILSVKYTRPNGETGTYTFKEPWAEGWSGWYGWADGIYNNPVLGDTGTLSVELYDGNGNKIGEHSVKITN